MLQIPIFGIERRRSGTETGSDQMSEQILDLTLDGLTVKWDPGERVLYFGSETEAIKPDIRYLEDMQEVLYSGDDGADTGNGDDSGGGKSVEKTERGQEPRRELYFMFRDLHLPEHRALFREKGVRYDITVIAPGTIGREYVKTAGHYHPLKPGTEYTYPEVYEVLYGEAHYLFQKPVELNNPEKGLEEVFIVAAGPGDKVLIPSGFGHVTINPGSGFLVMSNLVADNFASVYEPLREMGGAGYCQLCDPADDRKPCFVTNPCYSPDLPLYFSHPARFSSLLPAKNFSQYHAFVADPQKFAYLTFPEKYQEEFAEYLEALKKAPKNK